MDIESTANRLASPDKPGEIWAGASIDVIVDALREMSAVTDARELVEVFTDRVGTLIPQDRFVYISRRGLPAPKYRVTRCSEWEDSPDPWTEAHKLPVLEGGFMGELVFSNEPHLIPELRVDPDDPSAEYFEGMGSLIVIPQYENRESLNVMMLMRRKSHAFDARTLPLMVWTTNLFGRSVHMLRLGDEFKNTYDLLDLELKSVADVQRSLLPKTVPEIRTLELAAYCEMAQRAGGDYYDFLPLQNGNWGILIADVCGHGPAAAVLMAITHSIVHTAPKECDRPGRLLAYMNDALVANYTTDSRTFVTAFYGVYDPQARTMTYSSAGHLPPRLYKTAAKRIESLESPPISRWASRRSRSIPKNGLNSISTISSCSIPMASPKRVTPRGVISTSRA